MDTKLKCDLSDAEDFSDCGLPYVLTEAGSHKNEDNDCAIVALAIACDLPYRYIRKLASVCLGRKPKKPALNMLFACYLYPFKFKKLNKKRFRLHKLVKKYPKGRYYVQIGGRQATGSVSCHALALVDGKIHDRHFEPPDRWVTGVWRVDGLKSDSWWGWKRIRTDK